MNFFLSMVASFFLHVYFDNFEDHSSKNSDVQKSPGCKYFLSMQKCSVEKLQPILIFMHFTRSKIILIGQYVCLFLT